jgi:LacI family transcriptional regulator
VEGIIYVAAHERLIDVIPVDLPIPTVVAYGYTNNPEIQSVVVRDRSGAEKLVKHLIQCGHRQIGVIAGKQDSIHTQSRLVGYQNVLKEAGIPYDPDLVVYGEWDRQNGYENTDALLTKGVTALFGMNDLIAGGIYDRLAELGYHIGQDIAVVGYDNREMASYEKPPLTTMGLPLHDVGYRAGQVILHLLKKEAPDGTNGVYEVDCIPYFRDSVNILKDIQEN